MNVATAGWGYKPKSSGGLQTVGALIGYGLLEDTGSGADRKVRITEQARRILLDQRQESDERAKLIKECALAPQIFNALWSRWRDTGIPSPSSMRHALVFEYDFNENTVDDFISVFTQTIEFAGLTSADGGGGTGDDHGEPNPIRDQPSTNPPEPQMRSTVRKHQLEKGMQESTFPLAEGLAVVQWPTELSKESYEDFEAWVQLTLRRAKRSIVSPDTYKASERNDGSDLL
ncbi:MAG: hypothetical protein WD795_17785 [Woeseia sp.]